MKTILILHQLCTCSFLICFITQTGCCIIKDNNGYNPLPKDRISHLCAIANDDKYDFDTVDGNHLYSGFLDAYDEYRTQLILKKRERKIG